MKITRRDLQTVEMQMGPMIDMVFLLLVFFMVSARSVKQEADLGLSLPGTVSQEERLDIPDETRIGIQEDGQIVLNEMRVDSPDNRDLPELYQTLFRFKEAAESNKAEALITLDIADKASHQRVVDVMNVCAKVGISGVTFSTDSEEEN